MSHSSVGNFLLLGNLFESFFEFFELVYGLPVGRVYSLGDTSLGERIGLEARLDGSESLVGV